MKRIGIILVFLMGLQTVVSQEHVMHIRGTVLDTNGTTPIEHAIAMAVRISDSVLLGFQRSDKNGHFELIVPIDTFTLIVSHPKYDKRTFYIIGSEENTEIDIPSLKLYDKSTEIDELIIYAYKDPVHYRGDTLVYIADSFHVKPNAVVEDLLKKLPGMEVGQDGKIRSQGKTISKVLVDGDEFFGKDPTTATKNLAADAIETVEVYEKIDDDAIGSDEKIQVIDLKLKENAKKGYFGKTSLASDAGLERSNDPFYEGEVLLNKFVGSQKVSVFGLGSNTPKQTVAAEDADKFGLSSEEEDNIFLFNNSKMQGIPQTLKTGLYYTDKIGKEKKVKLGANYTYSMSKLDAYARERTQVFLTDTSYSTNDSTYQHTKTDLHDLNISVEFNPDTLTRIRIVPSVGITQKINSINTFTDYIDIDNNDQAFLRTFIQQERPTNELSFGTWASVQRKFHKHRREFEMRYFLKYEENTMNGKLVSRNTFPLLPSLNDTTDQTKENALSYTTNSLTATYTEPLWRRWRTSVIYQYANRQEYQNRTTNDYNTANGLHSNFRSDLSNDFQSIWNEHKVGLKLRFDTTKHDVYARLDVRNIDIENLNRVTHVPINQQLTSLLPSAYYRFKPSMSRTLSISYRTSSSVPSIHDLQPVPDNSDPNRIREGNPNLRPNYNHTIQAWFNLWNSISGSYIWGGITSSMSNNDFADSTVYNIYGQMTSKRVNVNGNMSASAGIGGGIPIQGLVIQLRPMIGSSYNKFNNYINGNKNITNQLSMSVGGEFVVNLDTFEMTLGANYLYSRPKNSLSSVADMPFEEQKYSASFTWLLPLGFHVKSDANYLINSRRTQGYNINSFVWNAEFGKHFLPTENLIVSIVANDLLDQNINTTRVVRANVITDNRTKVISRYFLAKVTLKFNSTKTKESEPKRTGF